MRQLDSPKQSQENPTPEKTDAVTSRVSYWLIRLVYPLGRHLVLPFYFGKIEVKGQEHLPKDGAVILAPTHRSRWDALVLPYAAGRHAIGRDLHVMISADEMKGLQGWFLSHLGGFPVNPRHPGISSLRHGIKLLEQGEVLVIFPEGNIFRTEEAHPFEPGLGRIALHAESNQPGLGIKIVPISIRYSDAVPHWGTDIEVCIRSPLQVEDYCKKPAKPCAEELMADLRKVLQ
ncbi:MULTISPECIES: lysophospholipid acyltransferase family protein [unclassified Coleofasciculus]|uniref:lysophospholipid acyltransferase family protein n=1 Tax=unclassified Coleofasciculus TaxID=2692782 RepID=UPI00187ED031|nr:MULTISPECIES: lysophospholipid acyltransferase family protein [unclassified Coleofasciculus]MBE9127254.1 1-acyl-sn-glycerol-3-phosphate acyltransferase [Coleofasciculus sp. LEGE 07081]MBE9150594.1 1-acyl-sn-glycerol-3-phosphate acyltransferase [Coleofasciculus sp. LEGE 07092]